MKQICVDCEENEATVADLYCDDCVSVMARVAELIEAEDIWKYTDDLDYSSTKGSVNLEDKVNRLHPQLSCTYCKPNKGENCNHHSVKNRMRNAGPKQRKRSRDLRKGLEFKKNQHKEES